MARARTALAKLQQQVLRLLHAVFMMTHTHTHVPWPHAWLRLCSLFFMLFMCHISQRACRSDDSCITVYRLHGVCVCVCVLFVSQVRECVERALEEQAANSKPTDALTHDAHTDHTMPGALAGTQTRPSLYSSVRPAVVSPYKKPAEFGSEGGSTCSASDTMHASTCGPRMSARTRSLQCLSLEVGSMIACHFYSRRCRCKARAWLHV